MSKRGPIKQMDHNNWDQEDEPEEAGLFNLAAPEAMKNRVIKKAKRNIPPTPAVAGAFSGFAGFASANNNNSGFQFSNSPAKPTSDLPKFSLSTVSSGPAKGTMNGAAANSVRCSKSDESIPQRQSSTSSVVTVALSASGSSKSSESLGRNYDYFTKLKELNTNVSSWISMHVSKNPCCILTPIFRDYERYLQELEKNYPSVESASKDAKEKNSASSLSEKGVQPKHSIPVKTSDENSRVIGATSPSAASTPAPLSSAWLTSGKGDASGKSCPSTSPIKEKGGFSLGTYDSFKSTTEAARVPSFGLTQSSSAVKDFKFSFGNSFVASTPKSSTTSDSVFSFAVAPTTEKSADADTAEEEYVPPKAEVNEIVEEDAFYSKRCKLFYKKDGSFVERGLGILYLKKLGEKTQLLIRADTSLGNILLNIMVGSSISAQRMGENNIVFCCIPNPPINPKVPSTEPVTMVVRVKTSKDAEELFGKMQPATS